VARVFWYTWSQRSVCLTNTLDIVRDVVGAKAVGFVCVKIVPFVVLGDFQRFGMTCVFCVGQHYLEVK
jgi:hypothetical protein